eukprot:Tamp_20646.p1 GENE.Tamp_20646~~Tamp_20646.p1  ORF type:complete len:198 (-),score=31.20 Tamp_20646:468-1061(-)
MMQAARDAGAAKRLDEDVERASQAATPELALCEQASPKRLKARSKTFDLGSCTRMVEPEYCASCKTEILTTKNSKVVCGLDLRFCSEGCRCVLMHGVLTSQGGMQMSNPCMNHDLICPHFATRTAGLVKDKFTDIKDQFAEYSPSLSPSLRMTCCNGTQAQPPAMSLNNKADQFDGLRRSVSESCTHKGQGDASMGM